MRALLLSGLFLCGLLGCSDDLDPGAGPTVDAIRPAVAAPGGTITLIGRRFGLQGPFDGVFLGGVDATIASWSDRAIRVVVPDDGRRGQLALVVQSEGRVSPPVAFEIIEPSGGDAGDAEDDAGVADDAGPELDGQLR